MKLTQKQKENLFRFNQTDRTVQLPESLASVFEEQVTKSPEAVAVTDGDRKFTYEKLNADANRIAHWLLQQGIGAGKLVGLCVERSAELPACILGILKTGAGYVPFDPAYPADRISWMLRESGISMILVQEELRDVFSNTASTLTGITPGLGFFREMSTGNPVRTCDHSDTAYVLFTSGSTGMPKGVAMPHGALLNLVAWQKCVTRLSDPAVTLQFAPISFDVSFQEMFTTWSTGGNLVMISDELRLNAHRLLEFIGEHRVERLFLPFIALHHLAEVAAAGRLWPPSLRDVITAGEQLRISSQITSFFTQLPECRLHNHYGPTETHVVTAYTLDANPANWSALPPIGTPVWNTRIYLLSENLLPVDVGDQGEIYVAGAALATGYINRPELTSERFSPDPFTHTPGSRMYRTGDIGRYLPDGNIEYLGRADDQVKVRGYRIELGEVEVAIGKHPGVRQAAVAVREDRPGDKRLVAYVVPHAGKSSSANELRKFLASLLPEYMMPGAFVYLDELPKTPSGKIDRRSLPKPDSSRPDTGVAYTPPQEPNEKLIAGVWSQLLGIDQVGIHDNFFDLGGNSLLALRFVAEMRQQLALEIPVVGLYRSPTIAGLTGSLRQEENIRSPLDEARERLRAVNASRTGAATVEDGIAIIGMAGRFPGADNLSAFWENLASGRETVSYFKPDELDSSLGGSLVNDSTYVPARGVLKDASAFDAAFFGINPRLAELMDPQQRIFLEVCWEGLEHAGYASEKYRKVTGVFAGMGNNTYYLNNVQHHQDAIDKVGAFQVMVANEKDYIATRVSHLMNLTGPAVSVHTACSTSLTATALACQALWDGHCDMAVAGGIAVTAPVKSGHLYQEGGMFSSDGHTRPFDAGASGTVFSDGTGVVVLKRYREAVADGDTVYAVIRGVGINNDGSAKASFTAPSVDGQAKAIAMALAGAQVPPESVTYIETHGTATPLGDPIEVQALTLAYSSGGQSKQRCAIGSVKSNFGHLTAAAGVAGLIKTVLSMRHRVIPATLNYSKPNPAINFRETPFYVASENTPWQTDGVPRRAGVSSFGVGGTNVHVILEEPPQTNSSGDARPAHLMLLSSRIPESLDELSRNTADFLDYKKDIDIADAAYTLQKGRSYFTERRFVVGTNSSEISELLRTPVPLKCGRRKLTRAAQGVAFMFPGQGSQYVNMGKSLYRDEIVFREAVERCVDLFGQRLGVDLLRIIYPPSGSTGTESGQLQQTIYTQPALFTIGYALSSLWMSWGMKPKALIGHSIGEFAAASIAGIMSLEDATQLVALRGSLMQSLPAGSMLSVRLSADAVRRYLAPGVDVAAINGPSLCVVSGAHEAVEQTRLFLEKDDVVCKQLHTSHAFHSPMMDPVVEPFRDAVASIKLNPPVIPVMSTATAHWLSDQEATDPGYWASHLRKPVRFAEGIRTLWNDKSDLVLIECGPRNTASMLARQQSTDPERQIAVPSLADNSEHESDWVAMLSAMGQLWLSGIDPDWNQFYLLERRKRIPMPSYPFAAKRYWVEPLLATSRMNTFQAYRPFEPVPEIHDTIDKSHTSMSSTSRKDRIVSELRSVMEDASGIELGGASSTSSFVELGLDSLFLTQAALTISKKYGVKVTFRQLNENYATLDALASYLDQSLPADPVTMQSAVLPQTNAVPSGGSTQETLQWLLAQQMQMMQQQMAMLTGINQGVPAAPSQVSPPAAGPEVTENEKAELSKPFGAIARIEKSTNWELKDSQKQFIEEFTRRYNARTAASKAYTQQHRDHLADPRVVTGFKPALKELIYQVVVNRSSGCRMWDLDGNEYVDVLNGFGSNFLGYGSPVVMKAVNEQLASGIELGPQHPLAGEVAKLICEFTGFDRAGFCNTGSEAVLGAMRIARTVTGRSTIVCFNGSYHGINDEVIVRGTRKLKSFPAAAGIMPESVQNMLVLDYGTDEALSIIRARAGEIAAVMVEPIQSRRADFTPKAFLQEVRKITSESGCLLIFDEVITGFRLLPGGAQEFYGIRADIGTYGKVIGGGMPIGVIAGRKEYMDALDGGFWKFGDNSVPEAGVTYFAGTFVRHPLALAAAKAVLTHMKERGRELNDKLNAQTAALVETVNAHAKNRNAPFHLVSFGSLFKVKWDDEVPFGELLFLLLRDKGVHIYDGFPCFITDAFSEHDIRFVSGKFMEAIDELVLAGFFGSGSQTTFPRAMEHKANGSMPPVPGARLGKDPQGNPGWFVPDPDRPGKYKQVFHS
jgi:amino acid adenylation domain-containing protein